MQNDSGSGDVNTDFIHETAYYLLDGDGKILSCNDDSESLLGYTIEEIEGHHYTQLLSIGGIYNEAIADLIGLATHLKKVSKEVQVAKKSGEIFEAEVILQSLSGRNKENRIYTLTIAPRHINSLTSDKFINDQQLLGIFLKYSEEVLFWIDRDRSIIAFNEAANRKALKYFNKAVQKGMSILEFVSADRQEAVIKMSINVLKGQYQEAELMHEDANGIKEYYKSHLSPVFNEKGEVEYAFLVQKNITEYVTALAQVEYERSNLSALINNTRDLMWSVDTKGAIMIANKAFEEKVKLVTGFTAIAKDNPGAGISAVNLATWQAHYERAFGGEMFTIIDHTVFPKEEWVEVSFHPVMKGNNVIGVACYAHDITERKIALEQIRQSERNLKSIFENTDDVLLLTDINGKIIAFNSGAQTRILLTSNRKLEVGEYLLDHVTDDRKPRIQEILNGVAAGMQFVFDQEIFDLDGIFHCYEYSVVPVLEDNIVKGICFNGRSITQRILANRKIEENEKRFRALVENSANTVTILDEKGKPKYMSPNITRFWGYSEEEAMQMDLFSLLHPDVIGIIAQYYSVVLANPGVAYNDIRGRMRHKDGSWRWFDARVKNMLHDPAIGGIVDSFRDINDEVIKDKELDSNRDQLQKIMDNSIDVICTADINGDFEIISKSAKELWGYTAQELMGKSYFSIIPLEDRPLAVEMYYKAISGNIPIEFETRFVKKDGNIVTAICTARWNAKEQTMFCIARDITEKKKLENLQKAELRRFGELFRFAPISICIFTGEDLVFEMANPIFLDTIGKTNVNGKKLMDVMPEMEGQGIVSLLRNVYTTGESYSGKEVLFQVDVTGNGDFEDIYSTFIYQPFRGVDGEIEGVFVI